MSGNSSIEWTDATWTPIRARVKQDAAQIAEAKGYTSLVQIAGAMAGRVGPHCEPASPGCDNCYSETGNGRCLPHNGTGLPFDRRARDLVDIELDENILIQPLHWRKARRVFVCSQTDLFGDFVPDEFIDRVVCEIAGNRKHTFQILTKRAARMRKYFSRFKPDGQGWVTPNGEEAEQAHCPISSEWWPIPNLHLGVSVEDQPRADERIAELLATPARVRWVSYEPALAAVNFKQFLSRPETANRYTGSEHSRTDGERMVMRAAQTDTGQLGGRSKRCVEASREPPEVGIDWLVVGGESGPGARPCDLAWLRSAVAQFHAAGRPVFVKQAGAKPWDSASSDIDHLFEHCGHPCECCCECPSNEGQRERAEHPQILKLKDRKGGDPEEWEEGLRVRELPASAEAAR